MVSDISCKVTVTEFIAYYIGNRHTNTTDIVAVNDKVYICGTKEVICLHMPN